MEAKSRRANGAWGPSDRARAGLGTALDGLGHSDQWGIAVCGPETTRAENKPQQRRGTEMSIQCVIFDVGGVLLTLGEHALRQEIAERFGLKSVPPEYESFVPAIQRGEITETEVWSRLAGREVECDFFEELFIKHFPPNREVIELAAELRGMGLRTAILSNTERTHGSAMRRMGFIKGFSPVFFSYEIGRRKPEREVYTYVLEQLELPPERVAYVDDIAEYIEAAERLGIRAICFDGDVKALRAKLLAMVKS